MDIYEYWIDNNGVGHKIQDMDNAYLERCLTSVEKWQKTHRNYTADDLDEEDLKEITKTGSKAWCVINAQKYIDVLEVELAAREAIE